jgi:glycosyltransferase involved in cell wall biosynthesis
MRIGIDATALPPQPVGAGNYIIQLIRSLSNLESEFEYAIFAQPMGWQQIGAAERDGFSWVKTPAVNPGIRLIWEQTLFPMLIRKSGVDLFHSLHYTRPYLLNRPSVVTFHDMTFFLYPHLHTRVKRIFFPQAIRLSARTAQAIIANSESTRHDAIRILQIPPEKIVSIILGVDPSFRVIDDHAKREGIRSQYKLPERFILYVGLVEPRKNVPLLIRAYKNLLDQGFSIPLIIVGRFGWNYEAVFTQIEESGLKEQVRFTGYVPGEDLPFIYNLASLSVYPTQYEGFGFPALEAMACGIPVITSAIASLPEIVADAGILIPPEDESALTKAMASLLSNAALHADLARKGPLRAAQFSWKKTAQETLQVYRQVLKGRG